MVKGVQTLKPVFGPVGGRDAIDADFIARVVGRPPPLDNDRAGVTIRQVDARSIDVDAHGAGGSVQARSDPLRGRSGRQPGAVEMGKAVVSSTMASVDCTSGFSISV